MAAADDNILAAGLDGSGQFIGVAGTDHLLGDHKSAEMGGGKGDLAVHDGGVSLLVAVHQIDLACGVKAVGSVQRNGDGGTLTLGVSLGGDGIGGVGAVSFRVIAGILSLGGAQAGETGGGNGHIAVGKGHLLHRLAQRNDGAGLHNGGIHGRITGTGTLGLQHMLAVAIEALDHQLTVGDLKNGHGHGAVGSTAGVAHITGVHVGKAEGVGEIGTGAALVVDGDAVAHRQVDGAAAHIVIVSGGVIVAEQEHDVQTGLAALVQHVIQVLGVLAVALGSSTGGVVQGQMGHHEDGLGIALGDLGVQIGVQRIGGGLGHRLQVGSRVVAPGIVLLVDDVDAVSVGVMGAGGGAHRAHGVIGVVVTLNIDLIHAGAVNGLHRILQGRLAGGGSTGTHALAQVAGKQEAVHGGVTIIPDGVENAGYGVGAGAVAGLVLEVGTGHHIGGLPCRESGHGQHAQHQHGDQQCAEHSLQMVCEFHHRISLHIVFGWMERRVCAVFLTTPAGAAMSPPIVCILVSIAR